MSGPMHTPGPWAFTDRKVVDEHLTLFRIESESVGYVVAENVDADDAPLISAAPELLAALKGMMPTNVCLTNRNIPDSTVVPLEMDLTMGQLRAVAALIAKAEGGAA